MRYTESYLSQLQDMYKEGKFGTGKNGRKWASTVLRIAIKYRCFSILDYGAGTGAMIDEMRRTSAGVHIDGYDPAVRRFSQSPSSRYDLVACIDTLEHIEPKCIDSVLDHIHALTKNVLFVVIATRLAGKILPDGRNAHLIVEDRHWWYKKLNGAGFEVMHEHTERIAGEYVVECQPVVRSQGIISGDQATKT